MLLGARNTSIKQTHTNHKTGACFNFSTTEKNQVFYSLIAQNTLNAMAKRLFSLL